MASTLSERISPGSILCAHPRARAIISAVAATFSIWMIATFIGDVALAVSQGASGTAEVGPFAVVIATLLAGLASSALLTFLERRTARAWHIWRTIAIIVFLISLLGPLGAETTNGRVALSVMHAVAAAIIVKGFAPTARRW